MKASIIILSSLLISSAAFSETDTKMAVAQINDQVLYSIRNAENEINMAESGLPMSAVEMCSKVAIGIDSADNAAITGLKELKRVKVIRDSDRAILEFLSLDFGDKYNGKASFENVQVDSVISKLKKFYSANCVQAFSEHKKIGSKSSSNDCGTSVVDSREDVIKTDNLNKTIAEAAKTLQK